nr:MAG TPA: hypothetical protein [Bacteriophage sp.]
MTHNTNPTILKSPPAPSLCSPVLSRPWHSRDFFLFIFCND